MEGWVGRTEGWMEEWKDRGTVGRWRMEGRTGVRAWKAVRTAGRKKQGMAGGLEGRKGGRAEGEGKAGWALEGDGTEKGPGAAAGQGGRGPGAVRCTALRRGSGRGGPPVPGRYMLSSSGTAPAPCLMAAVGAARGLHVLIFLPLLLLLLFHFIREQLMANKWQRDGQGTGRGRGRRGWGGSFQATRRGSGPRLQQFPPL